LHRHYHVPASNTALGHIVLEPVDPSVPPTDTIEGTSAVAQAMIA
jgi:protocatechuate 4,5-dioxygenase, beta chain